MNRLSKLILPIILLSIYFEACIPARQFDDMKSARMRCDSSLTELKARYETFTAKEKELNIKIDDLNKQVKSLTTDTMQIGVALRRLTTNYDKLNSTYDLLLDKNADLLKGKDDDNKKLMGQYQLTQEELQKKEDKLRVSLEDLEKRKTEMDILAAELKANEEILAKKEARVAELESVLAKKDSVVKALKDKVSNALLGFQGNGLNVTQKNGKVYVSLEERLLFESGSITVDARGAEAIKNLSKLLEKEPDINILVEGHTDNVPIKSAAVKDNWDLSVLRATSIVRIIIQSSKVNETRLTAAGRGEFFPIDKANTAEARKKNRRTEIILTPKLDELFQILEGN